MTKSYFCTIANRLFLPIFFSLFLHIGVQAQVDINIGTGTTTNTATGYPAPLQDYYEGSKAQYLYRAAELTAAGMSAGNITALKFNVTSLNAFTGTIEQFTVKIGGASVNALGATNFETVNNVVFGPLDFAPVVGINTITFTTPFFWNGTDNIIIETCNGDPNNASSTTYTENVSVAITTGLTFNATHTYRDDDLGNLCSETSGTNSGSQTSRPNLTLSWIPAQVCSGTPNPGTISTTSTNVCLGQQFTLNATGVTVASGLTYQWEASLDNINWSPIAGANLLSFTSSQSITTYYRFKVKCGVDSASTTSILISSPTLVGGTYTIDNLSPASATNFQSFNSAYNFMKCGINAPVAFNVLNGPYNEQLVMQFIPGSSATNTVTFNGNGKTISFASANTNSRAVIKLDSVKYVIFDSLVIDATAGTYGYGIQLVRNSDSNIVRKCIIKSSLTSTTQNFAGIVINGSDGAATATGRAVCDYNIFEKNTIDGGYYGITITASFNGGASGYNTFKDNQVTNFYQYGLFASGSYVTRIEANTFSRPTRSTVGDFNGIYFATEKNAACVITRNRILNPFGGATSSNANFYGIYFNSSSGSSGGENIVSNNLIAQLNGNGPQYGVNNISSDYAWYFNNTIASDNTTSTSSSLCRGFSLTGATTSNLVLYNNIVSITRGGTGTKHCIYLGGILPVGSDNNDFYISSPGTANYTGYYTSNRSTLANWQTATALDAASFSTNPAFVNIVTGDYSPGNAGIDNKGVPIPDVFVDIDSTVRSTSTPDIGAYEFTPPLCSTPPVTGTTVLSSTNVCQYSSVNLSLNIGPYGSAQLFQWQTSTDDVNYSDFGSPLLSADTNIIANTTLYYRVKITCGSTSVFTNSILMTVNPALPQGTYTINSAGGSTYVPGVPGGNFATFNDAKAAMSCGIGGPVIFNVVSGSGPYNEQLKLDTIFNVSDINTITFNGNGNTIAFSSTNANEKAVIKLTHTSHITFNNLNIDATGSGSNGVGVHLLNNADSNVFRNCTILSSTSSTSSSYAGIVINGSDGSLTSTSPSNCDGNLFANNTITGGFYGILSVSGATSPINDNIFLGNVIQDFYNYGVYIGNGNNNTIVDSSRITRPSRSVNPSTIYGIYNTGSAVSGLQFLRNRIYNLSGGLPTSTASIYFMFSDATGSTAAPTLFANNLLYRFSGLGSMYGIGNTSSSNINYYHNTIAIDSGATSNTSLCRGFSQTGTATGIIFKNNIVTILRAGTGTKHALYFGSATSTIESNNNDLYVIPTPQNYIGFDGSNRVSLANWQISSTQDANSFDYNPGYANPATEDYKPVVAPIDNQGVNVGITIDILSTARNTTNPDMGAFEFTVPPCSGPFAKAATVTPTTAICVDVPITLDIPGSVSASGLKFIWQSGPTVNGPFTDIVPFDSLYFPQKTYPALATPFYRALIVCSNGGVLNIDSSNVVSITLNPLLVAGSYTINKNIPTNYVGNPGANFNSFADAIQVMNCGITGKIVFNVSGDTYTEQVRIGRIPGVSPSATVTFNGTSSSSILTFSSTLSTANYVLKFDSTNYIIFNGLTINATSTTNGRAVEFAGTSNNDSLLNCIISSPVTTSTANSMAAIYATNFVGSKIVIKGNTINNGSSGINFSGPSATNLTYDHIIDGNTVNGAFAYSIYTNQMGRLKLTNNTVNISSPITGTFYGVYVTNCDSAYRVLSNTANINNVTAGSAYGIYILNSDGNVGDSGIVAGNKVIAATGNTGKIFGLTNYNSTNNNTVNNTIAIASSANGCYGLYSFGSNNVNYYNNSVNISVPTDTTSYAAYFSHSTTSASVQIKNNIFSNKGAGKAFFINNPTLFSADYNMLFTAGNTLVQTQTPNARYSTLNAWTNATYWDPNSIVFSPAFIGNTDLQPDLNNPDVWAIHGRGVQISGNSYDINFNSRPQTLTAGVPDLGAYEFYPTALPTALVGTPATPAPNTTQTFMYGTDTVMKVTWGANAPADVILRRYSGVAPRTLNAGTDSMYFYTKLESSSGGNFPLEVKQFYIDPWQGSIPNQNVLGIGRTTPGNQWVVGFQSRVDVAKRFIYESNLNFFDKFTGLVNPYSPPVIPDRDSSNRGRRFWVGYQKSWHFTNGSNTQDMVLYLSTTNEAATVEVKINGTLWSRRYVIPANTTRVSDLIPKAGIDDARLLDEGKYTTGISITSDVPITAYAHIYASTNSGASMLFPVGVWGYEYYSLNNRQNYSTTGSYNTIMVIADSNNTLVEITPTNPTLGGKPANVPFTVSLNKGEVYQVLGAMISGSEGYDLTGSKIKSIPNASGKCYPIAVFSGSSRTGLGCGTSTGGSGDLLLNQVFPYSAWGKEYLTSPTSTDATISSLMTSIYRIMVRDPATVVNVTTTGGAVKPIGSLINGRYYQYESNGADRIVADKPVMVAQYMSSSGSCPNTGGDGDPDEFILSPLEQSISGFSGFYRNNLSAIDINYLKLVLPNNGMNSLKIDNIPWASIPNADKYSFPHSKPGYTVAIKRWPAGAGQSSVYSDSSYTGQVYGLGSVESYGYNVGTLVKTLYVLNEPEIPGYQSSGYTCAGTDFKLKLFFPLKPDYITIKYGSVFGITPNKDTTFLNPSPTDSVTINGFSYYVYESNQTYVAANPGIYTIPVKYSNPDIQSCDNSKEDVIFVQVLQKPKSGFAINFPGCVGSTAQFIGDTTTETGIKINQWNWTFHDNTTSTIINPTYLYNTPGSYNVSLNTVTPDGCKGDTTKTVVVSGIGGVAVVDTTITVCYGADTTFKVDNPNPAATYYWYNVATGGSPLDSGATFTLTGITTSGTYYVQGANVPCISPNRTQVFVNVSPQLPIPTVVVNNIGSSSIDFGWNAITGATGYEVSLDTGKTWIPVSVLNYTVTGLVPTQTVCIIVRALGATACENSLPSALLCAQVGCPTVNVQVVQNNISVCSGSTVTFDVLNPLSGTSYSWYSSLPATTPIANGISFTTPSIVAATNYWVVATIAGGCSSTPLQVTADLLPQLATPVISVTGATSSSVTFSWTAITGATGYEVRILPGTTPIATTATTYTVTGLSPLQTVSISVTALGTNSCQNSISTQSGQSTCPTPVTIALPTDTIICSGQFVTFRIQNPLTTATYRWYDLATAGTVLGSGTTFTRVITNTSSYWVESEFAPGCISTTRIKVNATVNNILATPIVKVTDSTASTLTFGWSAVPGAIRYEVTANGLTTSTTNLSFTITGLSQLQSVTISVKAIGALLCQTSVAGLSTGTTLNNQVFIPNTFLPNSTNPVNQTLRVFSNVLKEGTMLIFNQWGEKIFESNNVSDLRNRGWDGTYKGKKQPVGVYIYIGKFTLTDGSVIEKKGSINLIR